MDAVPKDWKICNRECANFQVYCWAALWPSPSGGGRDSVAVDVPFPNSVFSSAVPQDDCNNDSN